MASATPQCDPSLLDSYLAGQGSRADMQAIEKHLDDCVACRMTIQSLAADQDFWTTATASLDARRDTIASPPPLVYVDKLAAYGDAPDASPDACSGADSATLGYLKCWLAESDDADALGRLDHYDVLAVVGCGGMGLVLKARDRNLRRIVAIKTLRQHLTGSSEARRRFFREAQVAAALRHPNIIDIHAVASWRDAPYLVMPFLEQGTLLDFAMDSSAPREVGDGLPEACARFGIAEILTISHQIASGLAEAHAKGMIHRDIKPSNILLERGLERVVIADFGLARAVEDDGMTHSGMVAGTPQFMSPEQARGSEIDTRSDLFSLGSLMFWLALGRSPFASNTSYGTISRIVNEPHTPPSQLRSDLPRWFDLILELLMTKDPAERLLSAPQLVQVLQQCVEHQADPVRKPLPVELRRAKRHVPVLVYAGSMLTILLACGGVALFAPTTHSIDPQHAVEQQQMTGDLHQAPALALPPSAVAVQPAVVHGRTGPLDALDELNLMAELPHGIAVEYWLQRLAGLPARQIPVDAMSTVEVLAEDDDLVRRKLALEILNKDPFEVIEPAVLDQCD